MAYWMLILDTKIGEIHIVVAKYVSSVALQNSCLYGAYVINAFQK